MKARIACLLVALLLVPPPARAAAELSFWKRLAPVVSRGEDRSPTLARILADVRSLDGVALRVTQRTEPLSARRAHSNLRVERAARPVRVDGEVLLPAGRGERQLLALLAHELVHVLQQAGVLVPEADDPRGEAQAVEIERAVLAELAERG